MESPSNSKTALAAIVLAAGMSRRMGAFKPLLPFGSQTVIEHTIEYLRAGGVHTIVVVIGHRADELRTFLQKKELLFVVNPLPESPMSESIKLAVATAPHSAAFLITPADHAAVPANVVAQLIEHWRAGAQLVVPTWQERGGHPVLIDGLFRRELLQLTGEGGLRSFFSAHQSEVDRVPVMSPYVVRDMDTWDDYVRLHNDFFGFVPKEGVGYPESQSN